MSLKNSNSSDIEYFSFFSPKAKLQVLNFEFCQIKLG